MNTVSSVRCLLLTEISAAAQCAPTASFLFPSTEPTDKLLQRSIQLQELREVSDGYPLCAIHTTGPFLFAAVVPTVGRLSEQPSTYSFLRV